MADDVLCPMCGKTNPADAAVCRYCQARLTPIPPQDDEPDWLRQLRAETPQENLPEGAGDDQEGEIPDWLARIRQKAGDQDPTSSSGLFIDDDSYETAPDWMQGLQSEEQPAASFGDNDDWLSRLGETPGAETPAAQGEPAQEPDLAGWLDSLNTDDTPPAPAADEKPLFDEWSGGSLFADEPPAAEQPAQSEESGDWLSAFKVEDTPLASAGDSVDQRLAGGSALWADEPEGVSSSGDESLDWLRSFEGEAEAGETGQQPAGGEQASEQSEPGSSGWGLTGWLTQGGGTPPGETPDLSQPAGEASDLSAAPEDLPDWLSSLPDASQEQEPEAASSEEIPAWLQSEDQDTGAQPPAAPASTDEVPDWLSGLDAPEPAAASAPDETAAPEDAGLEAAGLPDWLRSEADAGVEPSVISEAVDDRPIDDQVGWFAMIDDDAAAQEQEERTGEPALEMPVSDPAAVPAGEQPDWLQSLQAAGEETGEQEPTAAGPAPFIEEGLPDWMEEFKGQPPAEDTVPPLVPAEEVAAAFTGDDPTFNADLPDWLSEEAAERQAQESPVEGELTEEGLAQAELPSWVAAMRPVESAMKGEAGPLETDQRVEQAGPLSGIRGVLPADEQVISYRKPPVYSVKLRVTEKQRMHAALLENMLGQEVEPVALPRVRSHAPQILLRVLVALFLLLTLAGALLANVQLAPAPTFYPPEVIDLYEQFEALPAGATVLMAVDYEPGLSGEMQFAASMVVDHLMGRGAQIAVVSTVPTGPALADSLLAQVQRNRSEYDLGASVVNLGYLPGGSMSLVEFARDPRSAAPGVSGAASAWEQPALDGINDIQAFDRVLVVTDRAEAGRDWVEQVQPYLGEVPLLIVSSAQAAPLLMPYVESQQVQGLVAGQMGGTLYGQRTGRQSANPALGHYGAYQVGVLLAFVLTLIGAIVSAISSTVQGKQKNRE